MEPRNIRVNALAPGIIMTKGLLVAKKLDPPLKAALLERLGLLEDVAQVALFLASEEAAYISGERMLTAGGA